MYQLRDRLGRWGFGEIYEAVHKQTDEVRMLKIVRGRKAEDPLIRARMTRELNAAEQIDHPNVLKIESLGEDPGTGFFLVMAPMKGETLAERLSRGVTFLAAKAAAMIKDLVEGMAAAHRRDIIHGELNPDTIFLKEEFGLSVPLLTGFGLPPSGTKVGQPPVLPLEAIPYAAPERRLRGEWSVLCDVFSISAVFAHLLAGRPPPPQGWTSQPAIPDDAAKESRDFLELAFRGMSKDPADRYPSMEAFAKAIGFLLEGRSHVVAATTRKKGQVKRRTPPPPLPTKQTGRPPPIHAKTILGVAAVQPGKVLEKEAPRQPSREGFRISITQPRFNASTTDQPPPPPAVVGEASNQPPPPPPNYPIDDTQKRKMDLVLSEAAKDAVGIMPLEPEVFSGPTGSVPDVDSVVITPLEKPPEVSQKRNLLWFVGGTVVLGVCLLVLFLWKPWKSTDSKEIEKSGKEKIATVEGKIEKKGVSEETEQAEKEEDKKAHETDEVHGRVDSGDGGEGERADGDDIEETTDDTEEGTDDAKEGEEAEVVEEDEPVSGDGKAGKEQRMSSSDQYNLYLRQGLRAMKQKRYELARRQFTQALKIKSSSFRARLYMGQTYQRAGQYREAVHWFNRALKVSPKSASTHLSIAQTYLRMKNRKAACRYFNRALKLRPNSRKYKSYVENHSCR